MNKIIFLDIDGVLNVYPVGRDEFGSLFHKHFVENLGRIVSETGAKIVITSTWRSDGLDRMREMWVKRGYPGVIIDITPNEFDVVRSGKFEFYDLVDRGHEIELWLSRNSHINYQYVIIDDDNDFLDYQRDKFVRCSRNISHPDCVDIGYGLTSICADKAIKILNK